MGKLTHILLWTREHKIDHTFFPPSRFRIESENLNLLRSRDFKPRPPYHEKINLPAEDIKSSVTSCKQEINTLYKNTVHTHAAPETIPCKQSSRSSPSFGEELLPNSSDKLMKQLIQSKEKIIHEGLKHELSEMTLPTAARESVAVQTECEKVTTRDFASQINR